MTDNLPVAFELGGVAVTRNDELMINLTQSGRRPGAPRGRAGRVAQGDCSPSGSHRFRTCANNAYGSSYHDLATGRQGDWTAVGGGSG
jgi:hypothetical protein